MPRTTHSVYGDELERMQGSCESSAKSIVSKDRDMAIFLMGASAGLGLVSNYDIRPENANLAAAADYPRMMTLLSLEEAEDV